MRGYAGRTPTKLFATLAIWQIGTMPEPSDGRGNNTRMNGDAPGEGGRGVGAVSVFRVAGHARVGGRAGCRGTLSCHRWRARRSVPLKHHQSR